MNIQFLFEYEHSISGEDLFLMQCIVKVVKPFRILTDKLQADGVTISQFLALILA